MNEYNHLNIEQLQAEIENIIRVDAERIERGQALLTELEKSLEEDDPHEDKLLRIKDALCLPELGGKLMLNVPSTPSDTVTEGMMREAIRRGQLVGLRPNKNLFVTRRYIREWMTACRVDATPQSCGSSRNTKTRMARLSEPSGSSNISMKIEAARLASAQDLARAKAMKLKNSLRNGF